MSYAGETADEFMRFTMDGVKVMAQITGAGAKQLLALILAILNDKKETIGKTKLKNMLKSGKELKVFTIREKDLKIFQQNAKRYGISYTALLDRKHKTNDGIVDILVKSEDAPRINRMVERFSLMVDESAKIRTEVQKVIEERNKREQEEKQKNDDLLKEKSDIEDGKAKPVVKEGQSAQDVIKNEMIPLDERRRKKIQEQKEKQEQEENFTEAKTEKGRPSEPKSKTSKNTNLEKIKEENRPSVRQQMKEIKLELEREQGIEKVRNKNPIKRKDQFQNKDNAVIRNDYNGKHSQSKKHNAKHITDNSGKHTRTSRAKSEKVR